MTRKDFELIARALKVGTGDIYGLTHQSKLCGKVFASRMADALASDNPRFDRTRFLQACGIEED